MVNDEKLLTQYHQKSHIKEIAIGYESTWNQWARGKNEKSWKEMACTVCLRRRHKGEILTDTDFKGICFQNWNWIDMAQNSVQWRIPGLGALGLLVSQSVVNHCII